MMWKHGTQTWTGLYCAHLKFGSGCGFSDTDSGVGRSSYMEAMHADMETRQNLGWARIPCYFSHFQLSAVGVLRKEEKCVKCGGPAEWKERSVPLISLSTCV